MDDSFSAMPGFVRLYNRLPQPLEFQYDSRPYAVPAHRWTVATVELAIAAYKASRYKTLADGTPLFGVVFENSDEWGIPLTEEELHADDPILGNEIDIDLGAKVFDGRQYGPPEAIRIRQTPETLPKRRSPIDAKVASIIPGAAEG